SFWMTGRSATSARPTIACAAKLCGSHRPNCSVPAAIWTRSPKPFGRSNSMRTNWPALSGCVLLATLTAVAAEPLRLITIAPGHFHASQLHVTMLSGFSDEAHIYAPLGPELTAHLARVAAYNSRAVDPTSWKLVVYAGPDFLDRMRAEPPGNMVMLSGQN